MRGKTAIPNDAPTNNNPRVAVVVGDGAFEFPVVGESHYQENIEQIAGGKTEHGAHYQCTAVLFPEPTNRYDPHAVRVDIQNKTVGYLSRDVAGTFLAALVSNDFVAAVASAIIVGGWDRGSSDVGSFGVKLNAVIPFVLSAAKLPADTTVDAPSLIETKCPSPALPEVLPPPPNKKSGSWIKALLLIIFIVIAYSIFSGNSKADRIVAIFQSEFGTICDAKIEGLFSNTLRLDWTASTTKLNSITVMAAIGNAKSNIYNSGIRYLKFPNSSGGYNIIDWNTGEKTSVSESARYYFP